MKNWLAFIALEFVADVVRLERAARRTDGAPEDANFDSRHAGAIIGQRKNRG
jgi:hypothetical protein